MQRSESPVIRRLALPVLLLLGACRSPAHEVAPASTAVGCTLCYSEVERVRVAGGKSPAGRVIRVPRHQCPECRGNVEIVSQDGVDTLNCSHCAPEGVACDRCVPPAKQK